MNWRKLGRVYAPDGSRPWAVSHAYVPTPLLADDETIRVYVSFWDADKVGRVGFVDVDARDPTRVLRVAERPALDVGEPGMFDDNGVTPVGVVEDEGRLYLFYFGWQVTAKVRYLLFLGLAASEDGGDSFRRCSSVPLLERLDGERYVRSASALARGGDEWRMWYVSGDRWIDVGGKQVPTYEIRTLASADLRSWPGPGTPSLQPQGDEFGFGRPFVLARDGGYRMWYSIRSRSAPYRLGYAESDDGLAWVRRDDEVGIGPSEHGWDSEMLVFSVIQETPYGTYMFFNGNNFGETGFGVAVLEDE